MSCSTGEFKQEVLKIYNEINKNIFHCGVRQQNVDFIGNKIVIVSINSRVPILKLLDENHEDSTGYLNYLLSQALKKEIKRQMEQRFQLNIVAVCKDYEKETEYSGTIILLDRNVEDYLNEFSELI